MFLGLSRSGVSEDEMPNHLTSGFADTGCNQTKPAVSLTTAGRVQVINPS